MSSSKMIKSLQRIMIINKFLKNFKISRKLLFLILALMIISAIGEALSAGLIIPFLNSLQNAGMAGDSIQVIKALSNLFSGTSEDERFLYVLLTILMMMSIVQLLSILTNRLNMKFSIFLVQNRVANILFKELLDARLKFFYRESSGSLINYITTDVSRSYSCILYLLQMSCALVFALAYIIISLVILPAYTLLLLLVIGLFLFFFKKMLPYIYSLGYENRAAQQDANNIIVETIQGVRSIMLSCAQKLHQLKFKDIIHKFYSSIFKSLWISTSIPIFLRLLSLLVVTLILILSKKRLLQGNPEYFSLIIFFIYAAGNIFLQLGRINSIRSNYIFNFEGIAALLKFDADLKRFKSPEPVGKKSLPEFRQGLEVKNLSFGYNSETRILDNLSFNIQRNRRIAFVGSSGSGKSTLIDVISGFHNDYSGSILVDGRELRDINKDDWRNMLGYVSQETFIFNDTVRNNLTFGFTGKINDDELIDACRNAQLYETISSFREKFETELGERGIRLSGGEKQRLAIARIFLKNPTIVLLDEATSSLDSEAEKKVKEALDALGKGRTVIAVAHRLSTISDYDFIHVIEKGKIVESGTHSELIAKRGYYHKYFTIQSMEPNDAR